MIYMQLKLNRILKYFYNENDYFQIKENKR